MNYIIFVCLQFDLEAEEYVPLPKGDVHKRKEVIQVRKKIQNNKLIRQHRFFFGPSKYTQKLFLYRAIFRCRGTEKLLKQ